MNRSLPLITLFITAVLVISSCSSGKNAYKHGDYYEAVLTSVQRLRQNPGHKKSSEILKLSYQAAVDYLNTDAQNQINANANFKWRNAVSDYEKINNLYEQIRTSPGALRVIPNPVNKYKDLTDARKKAAEEVYEAGVQALMKNTREDAKQAYYLFKESSTYTPGYREAVEMMNQAEYNATFRVTFDETNISRENFSLVPAVNNTKKQFLRFYTAPEAANSKDKIDQNLKLIYKGCVIPQFPSTSKNTEEITKDVKVGEKEVNGKKEPVYESVKAKLTTFNITLSIESQSNIQITDSKAGTMLTNEGVNGVATWQYAWATYSGDERALSSAQKELIKKKEQLPNRDALTEQARQNLLANLTNRLRSFYSSY